MQLEIIAPQPVLDAIASIGRTEDVRFSPDRRRVAVVAHLSGQIFVFDIEVRSTAAGKQVHLATMVVYASDHLLAPHGLDFVDDHTLAVANREGELCLFRLPPRDGTSRAELSLLRRFPSDDREFLGPGSVAATRRADGRLELLVCRNHGHRITRHRLDAANGYVADDEQVLLGKWLDIPDGITLDAELRWLAVSNHNTQHVLLYPYAADMQADSDPLAVLRGVNYPHGLRFSEDSRYLLVADAGAPYVHLYHQPDACWQGIYDPALSLRVMDEALFQSGNENPQEGGPKGIDIDCRAGILVTSCGSQALAFFDLDAVLGAVRRSGPRSLLDVSSDTPALAEEIRHELNKQQRHARTMTAAILDAHQAAHATARAEHAEAQLADMTARAHYLEAKLAEMTARVRHTEAQLADTAGRADYFEGRTRALLGSSSWRVTAPLRWLLSLRRNEQT